MFQSDVLPFLDSLHIQCKWSAISNNIQHFLITWEASVWIVLRNPIQYYIEKSSRTKIQNVGLDFKCNPYYCMKVAGQEFQNFLQLSDIVFNKIHVIFASEFVSMKNKLVLPIFRTILTYIWGDLGYDNPL